MIWYENLPFIQYVLLDRESSAASLDLYFQVDADLDSLWSAIGAETRYTALSECNLLEHKMTVGAALVGAPDATGSNLSSAFIVLYSVADTYSTIVIPGIRGDLLISEGPFAAQQIDMTHPDVVALNSALLTAELVTPRGDPVLSLSSGGGVNMWSPVSRRSG